jgi:hypothetical protein
MQCDSQAITVLNICGSDIAYCELNAKQDTWWSHQLNLDFIQASQITENAKIHFSFVVFFF